jgi:hypothetical protein
MPYNTGPYDSKMAIARLLTEMMSRARVLTVCPGSPQYFMDILVGDVQIANTGLNDKLILTLAEIAINTLLEVMALQEKVL